MIKTKLNNCFRSPRIFLFRSQILTTITASEFFVRKVYLNQSDETLSAWLSPRLSEMGPTYVKIGQYVASRSDIFGSAFSEGFKGLHDDVSPMNDEELAYVMQDQPNIRLNENVIASASIGQVHNGYIFLRKNDKGLKHSDDIVTKKVAVKIRRLGIKEHMRSDISFMRSIVSMIQILSCKRERDVAFRELLSSIDEFEEIMMQEIDYESEVRNMIAFRKRYRMISNQVRIPKVYKQFCTQSIIVMEYIDTTNIIDNIKISTKTRYDKIKRQMASDLMIVFINQLIYGGIMHGDPHLGNMGIDSDNRLVLFDFGNIVYITPNDRQHIKDVIMMLIIGNSNAVMSALERLGVEIIDKVRFVQYLDLYRMYMKTVDVKELSKGIMQNENIDSVVPIKMTSQLVRIFRVFSILEGSCKSLDPDFNYFKLFRIYAPNVIGDQDFFEYKAINDTMLTLSGFRTNLTKPLT